MTSAELVHRLNIRRLAIQGAWRASRALPGSPAYEAWRAAYGAACRRVWRAAIMLPQ